MLQGIPGAELIVTVSPEMRILARLIVESTQINEGSPLEVLDISSSDDLDTNARRLFRHSRKRAVLLTSVIGTGASLSDVLSALTDDFKIEVAHILAVVDARESQRLKAKEASTQSTTFISSARRFPLSAIVRHPLRFLTNRPSTWRREDVRRIDPATNAPTRSQELEHPQIPIWGPPGEFLRLASVDATSVRIGHFADASSHYVFYFEIHRIVRLLGAQLAELICNDIRQFELSDDGPSKHASFVFYDDSEFGGREAAEQVARLLVNAIALPVQQLELSDVHLPALKQATVILIVGAIGRGASLKGFIHSVRLANCATLLVYALIVRKESDGIPFFQYLSNYDGLNVRIRTVLDLDIPAYTQWDCPACLQLQQVGALIEITSNDELRAYLRQRLAELSLTVLERGPREELPETCAPDEAASMIELRARLGESKTRLEARYDLSDVLKRARDGEQGDAAALLYRLLELELDVYLGYTELMYPSFRQLLCDVGMLLIGDDSIAVRTKVAIVNVLARLDGEWFLGKLAPILTALATNADLHAALFAAVLQIAREGSNADKVESALELSQSSLESEVRFKSLRVSEVIRLQHLLSYMGRRVQYVRDMRLADAVKVERAVASLWRAIMPGPSEVHPAIQTLFTAVAQTPDVQTFERVYREAYAGEHMLGYRLAEMARALRMLADSPSVLPPIRPDYFLTRDALSFARDVELLDSSLRGLAAAMLTQTATDDDVDATFYYNHDVVQALDRLERGLVGEGIKELRSFISAFFAPVNAAIEESVRRYRVQLDALGVNVRLYSEDLTAFLPTGILEGVIDGIVRNAVTHAFRGVDGVRRLLVVAAESYGTIALSVFDNGSGGDAVAEALENGSGLRRSRELIADYGGTIDIVGTCTFDDEQWSTAVKVSLQSRACHGL